MKMQNRGKLFIAVIFFWIAMYVYIPYQTTYLKVIGTASNQIGIIVGAYGISQMLLRFPVGILADRQNYHKIFILAGGGAASTASVFRILLNNSLGFFIGNIFSGLASAMWISFMVLYMSYYPDEEQREATGKIVFANNIGMLGGFVISTLLYQIVGMQVICGFSDLHGICVSIDNCKEYKAEKSGTGSTISLMPSETIDFIFFAGTGSTGNTGGYSHVFFYADCYQPWRKSEGSGHCVYDLYDFCCAVGKIFIYETMREDFGKGIDTCCFCYECSLLTADAGSKSDQSDLRIADSAWYGNRVAIFQSYC